MALGRNDKGQFLVFSESNEGGAKCVFMPDGEQASSWWQLMYALYEVVGVSVTKLNSEKKNEKEAKAQNSDALGAQIVLPMVSRCPCC